MQVTQLEVVYRYDGIELPCPDNLIGDADALKAFHASLYPAITTADAVVIGVENGKHITEYRRAIGTKG